MRIGRLVGAGVVLVLAIFWIGATIWFFGDENPDLLEDKEWVASAETRCDAARDELDTLPPARNAANLTDRANQIELATAVLADLVADLRESAPADDPNIEGDDGELLELWLGSWDVYLGDRLTHAEALRNGEDRRFRVTVDSQRSEGVDALLDAFADRNNMPTCGDPFDIG